MPPTIAAALLGTVLAAGCAAPEADPLALQKGGGKAAPKKPMDDAPTPPTTELVTVKDPVEGAFSMGVPKGWENQAYSARVFDIHSMVLTSVSPNGSVLLFSGDPGMPQYWNPAMATPVHYDMARINSRMRIEPFQPAEQFFPDYVKRKFGKLPDFELESTTPDEEGAGKLRRRFQEAGVNMNPTAAFVRFSYSDGGKPMHALIQGYSTDSGAFWMPMVSGIATTGDPKAYLPMMEAMGKTHRMNPEWQAAQATKHGQRMAEMDAFSRRMTAQHNANMAAIQASAQAHQTRMQALWAQNDASMQSYQNRMASMDSNHRSFLNYIKDENTVVGASGKTYQVATGYTNYFVNKNDRTYVGGDIRLGPDQLRSMGLNPDDYEEVQIKP